MTAKRLHRTGEVHPLLKFIARIISVFFHPLFIPVYLCWFIIQYTQLLAFLDPRQKILLLIQFFVSYTLLPLATMLLAKGLGFVQSIYLNTQKDRILPYIACGIFYFWIWYVLRSQQFPKPIVMLSQSIFFASSIGLLMNIYFKVSMHALSLGVMISFIITLALVSELNFGIYISMALFITGLVATARLINSDHQPFEVYGGLVGGIIAFILSYLMN